MDVKPGQVISYYADDEEVVFIDNKLSKDDKEEIVYIIAYLTDFTSNNVTSYEQ